jgi:arylsulfatase
MLKNTRVQMIAKLAIGGLLGFAAASGKVDVFRKSSAEPPRASAAAKASRPAEDAADCCQENLSRGQLLAMADPKVKEAVAKAEENNGKKPNIVFFMGDDIGWFNIGVYHRGIMSGKTPNLDKLASRACCSPTTTPRRAARRAEPASSPARFHCARA